MAIESADDRQAFMEVFGVSCVVDGSSITAIYDDPHIESLGVSSSSPMLTCMDEDIAGVSYGDSVVVSSMSFTGTVKDIQSDGTGITVLMLVRGV